MTLDENEMKLIIACSMDHELMQQTMRVNSIIAWASMDSELVAHCAEALSHGEKGWVDATN
jgi:ABC-type uncharacterized transport system ATPase subunit